MASEFCRAVEDWNRIHRLIGNVSCETLLTQAIQALKNSHQAIHKYRVLVDIGAGAGFLGAAWISLSSENKAVFIEPDSKSAAFLHSFFSSEPRTRTIGKRLEDPTVLSADLKKFLGDNFLLVARAFSSSEPLNSLIKRSVWRDHPLFLFECESGHFSLRKQDE